MSTLASALPKAVRAQVEKANQIADEYYKRNQQGQPPADPPTDPPADPPAAPPAPGTPPADPPATPPPATPLPQAEWEQKYKVLQGKYNAEVPRMQRQVTEQQDAIRQLRDQLTATQNLLASLSAQRTTAPAQPSPGTSPAPTKLVKDEEVREFGPDLYDFIKRAARETHAELIPEVERRVAPVAQRVDQTAQAVQQVGNRVTRNDQQSVFATLSEKVPTWEAMNEDPGFLNWLDQIDPYTGKQRGALLDQAFQANDGSRVVAFFSGYLKEHATVAPPAAPAPAAAAPPAAPQRNLEQFVAPGTPKTGAASTQDGSGKRVWTRAEIGKFYADCQAGRFKGSATDRKAVEADIFLAQKEGRIR